MCDLCLFTLTHMSIMRCCFHLMLVPLHGTVLLTGKLSVAAEGNSLRGVHVLLSHIWLCNSVSHLKSTLKYRLCVSAAFCLGFSQAKNTWKSTFLQFYIHFSHVFMSPIKYSAVSLTAARRSADSQQIDTCGCESHSTLHCNTVVIIKGFMVQ